MNPNKVMSPRQLKVTQSSVYQSNNDSKYGNEMSSQDIKINEKDIIK